MKPKGSFVKKNQRPKASQRKKINFLKIIYWFLILIFFISCVFVFFFSGFLKITKIEFSGTQKTDSQRLREELNDFLSGRYLGLIPKNNWLLIRENTLNQVLSEKFKLVEKISVQRIFPDQLRIRVTEVEPWVFLENVGGRFILDSRGQAYPEDFFAASGFQPETLPVLKEEEANSVALFNQPSGLDYLKFIFELKKDLEIFLDIKVRNQMITSRLVSGDVFFETEEGWKIFFNQQVAEEKSVEMLKTVLENKIKEEERKNLEYIDLRIDNKVFYKLKILPEENPKEEDEKKLENAPVEPSKKKDKNQA